MKTFIYLCDMNKWLFYIDDFKKPLGKTYWSKAHWFKSFKVYWAYRWYVAEQMDFNGVHDPADRTQTRLISVGYRFKYCK